MANDFLSSMCPVGNDKGNDFDAALILADTAKRTMRAEDIDAALSAMSALPPASTSPDRSTLRMIRAIVAGLGLVIRYNDLTANYRRC